MDVKQKDFLLERIRRRSEQEAAYLAGEFTRAASEEREEMLAALELEQWLATGCRECLPDHEDDSDQYYDQS